MIGERIGHSLDRVLAPLARNIRLSPNAITVTGFLVTAAAAAVLTRNLFAGGLLVAAGGLMDLLDGAVARVNGRATAFGAFLDSVLDRYSDALLFIALAWRLGAEGDSTGALLSVGTLAGALIVSYARARAEGLGKDCKVGIMERPERLALIILGALTGLVKEVMWVMFLLTHITVIQRVLHVRNSMQKGKDIYQ